MAADAGLSRVLRARAPVAGAWRLIAGQTALLFSGFAAGQLCAFLRNAIIAHTISRGDFGIASLILATLQIIETLTDMSADKLIIQADDGASSKVVGTAQSFQLIRGIATAALILATAYPLAIFYRVPEATVAFMAVALAPLMRGLVNLDMRREQRVLNNTPYIAFETAPQMIALAATPLALWVAPTYAAVVIIAVIQAGSALLVSGLAARQTISFTWDWDVARRMLAFSWPIWLSAIPLVAVLQGDRVLIGRILGMEAVAGYAAAFLITMVPAAVVVKVGHALLMPLLSEVKADPPSFFARFKPMIGTAVALSLAYLAFFQIVGGLLLSFVFGPAYTGLHAVVALLALMWAMRMIQAVPGIGLMALGQTRALLIAGIIRATGLVPAAIVLTHGGGLVSVALVAVIAELASLLYVIWILKQWRRT
ncbi:MAG: oligosaccharide flippase family protein [Pseudomonadota bacterium]